VIRAGAWGVTSAWANNQWCMVKNPFYESN